MINILNLIDDKKCYEMVRKLRWPEGVHCPHCGLHWVKRLGFHVNHPHRQRYQCKGCEKRFDDLTDTVLSGHHQPVKVWMLCLYFMGLNLSNQQIAQELKLNKDDVHQMTTTLREGICQKSPAIHLSGEVECDEVYIVAGHKGNPEGVRRQERLPRRNRLKAKRGRGTLATEKPPIFGMIQRRGLLVIRMLTDVQQKTIQPLIQATIQAGATIFTDEYNIYAKLEQWGFIHRTVNHSQGEFARDEDNDGFHEVHTNTMEGVWSLLRSWLRPHRGISQEKLPLYLGFFQFVHNTRKRGLALLPSLLATLLAP